MLVVTGGSGRLGTELKKLFPDAVFPTREELDITIPYSIVSYFNVIKPTYILHCAAFTATGELHHLKTNIIGTSYLVEYALQKKIPVAYVSTMSEPSDSDYGWAKLGGECAIRLLKNHLVMFLDPAGIKIDLDKIAKQIYILISKKTQGTYYVSADASHNVIQSKETNSETT